MNRPYEPTAEEIQAACMEIQRTWKHKKGSWRRNRLAQAAEPWTPPIVKVSPKMAAELEYLRIGRRGI